MQIYFVKWKIANSQKVWFCHYFGGTWAATVTGIFGRNPPAEEQQMPSPTKSNPCADLVWKAWKCLICAWGGEYLEIKNGKPYLLFSSGVHKVGICSFLHFTTTALLLLELKDLTWLSKPLWLKISQKLRFLQVLSVFIVLLPSKQALSDLSPSFLPLRRGGIMSLRSRQWISPWPSYLGPTVYHWGCPSLLLQ